MDNSGWRMVINEYHPIIQHYQTITVIILFLCWIPLVNEHCYLPMKIMF